MSVDEQQPSNDQPTDVDNVRAEVATEQRKGWTTVTLVTEFDEVDIEVPPLDEWRSSARNALFSRGDDLAWAAATLSAKDFESWSAADPTKAESEIFFRAWGEQTGSGLGESRRDRRASQRSHARLKAI